MKPVTITTLPLMVPVVMASSSGDTLDEPENKNGFVQLYESEDGTVSIRSAINAEKHLVLSSFGRCIFDDQEPALRFNVRMSLAGLFVFEEPSTRHVLAIETQGETKLIECREKYLSEAQAWYILSRNKLDTVIQSPSTLDPFKLVGANEDKEAGRRQLILHFLESGKSVEATRDILTLLYGSAAPQNDQTASGSVGTERRQHILKYIEAGKSTAEVGDILTLLYGTRALLK